MSHTHWPAIAALAALTLAPRPVSAADLYPDKPPAALPAALPQPADPQSPDVKPAAVALKGLDDAQQLILTAAVAGRPVDLTHDARYEVADDKVVRVTSSGRVVPLANGATTVTARYGDRAVKVAVKSEHCDVDR